MKALRLLPAARDALRVGIRQYLLLPRPVERIERRLDLAGVPL